MHHQKASEKCRPLIRQEWKSEIGGGFFGYPTSSYISCSPYWLVTVSPFAFRTEITWRWCLEVMLPAVKNHKVIRSVNPQMRDATIGSVIPVLISSSQTVHQGRHRVASSHYPHKWMGFLRFPSSAPPNQRLLPLMIASQRSSHRYQPAQYSPQLSS